MNQTQEAKLRGMLPDTKLEDASAASISSSMMQQMEESHCGNPIRRDNEIAASDKETVSRCLDIDQDLAEDFIKLHQQMPDEEAEEAGSGSWRAGCQHMSQWYGADSHAMTYYVERDTFSSGWRRPVDDSEYQDIVDLEVYDEDVANQMGVGSPFGRLRSVEDCKRVFVHKTEESARDAGVSVGDPLDVLDLCFLITEEINRRVGCACVRVYTGPNGQHNAHARGRDLPGGLAGFAFFNNGTCGDHVNMVLDNLLRSGLIRLLNLTAHEFGHWLNLQHQFSGQSGPSGHHELMSYSTTKESAKGYSTGQSPFKLRRAPSLGPLQRFFDWQNHIPPLLGETPPPPPPPPTGNTLTGELVGEIIDSSGNPVETDLLVAIRGELLVNGQDAFIMRAKTEEGGEYEPFPKPS